MNNKIIKTNKLLIKKFGNPPRNNKMPDPLEMLIATILSQNTNDKNSYQAYKNLREKYPTYKELASAERRSIEKVIKIAGLGKQKSGAIKEFLKELYISEKKYSLDFIKRIGDVEAVENLTQYRGVGVKTASCVLLFALNRNICPVDTHVHRTVNRIGITKATSPDKTFWELNKKFPPKIAHSFHTNLIRLGREICKPQNPACGICPLLTICNFEGKNPENKKNTPANDFMLLDNINS